MRIAIGAVLFEGNTLSPLVNTLQDFRNKYLVAGPELVPGLRASGTEMAGAIRALEVAGAGIAPLIATHGGAGGTVSRDAYAPNLVRLVEDLVLRDLPVAAPSSRLDTWQAEVDRLKNAT